MHLPARPLTSIDPVLLRRTLGSFATGVTVVTVGGPDPHGMTANSFTAVSLDPPLVLICVRQNAVMYQRLIHAGTFGVSVLAAHQEGVARHFARRNRPPGREQFDAVRWFTGGLSAAPLLTEAAARLECEVWRTYDGGDHGIFLGRLLSFDRRPDAGALLFLDGRFGQLHREAAVDLTT